MVLRLLRRLPCQGALSGAALLVLAGLSARGQYAPPYPPATMSPAYTAPWYGAYPPPGCYRPPQYPGMMPTGPVMPFGALPPDQPFFLPPHPCLPGMAPPSTEKPSTEKPREPGETRPPGDTTRPPDTTPSEQGRDINQPSDQNQNQNQNADFNVPSEQGAATGTGDVALAAPGGYLDNPIPITTFRLRNDAAFDMNRPDRAEYFYGAWQELGFHPHGIQGHGAFFDRHPLGPNDLPGNLNYQQPEAYFEFAGFKNRLSGFIQVPYRIVQFHDIQEEPDTNFKKNIADQPNPGSKFFSEPIVENVGPQKNDFNGFSDLQFGFKAALIAAPKQFLTFQLRTYSPTGNSFQGLGTGHWSLEPSLLYYQRFNRLVLQGQLTEWSPIGGGEAGNIFEYGAGLGYAIYQRGNFAIMPITEFLGWTVLNGYESVSEPISATSGPGWELPTTHGVELAGGNTIVNGKWGVRVFFGNGQSLYAGYGRALTGTHWYTDDFRLEYRIFFGRSARNARAL